METSGFSDTQLQVREAIAKICSNFPDVGSEVWPSFHESYSKIIHQEYWAAHDESGEYPNELHATLANDGWIGIALPEELGGSGLGISEATMMMHTISE
jgi:acyl-CoA dehydrogenase